MAESGTIEIFGVKELDDFFQSMSRADQRKLIVASWRLGARPLITTARQLLRSRMKTKSTTRNLEKSIGFVAGRARGKTVYVSAKVGARKFGENRGYHGHLYDAGTGERQTRSGKSRGQMPASRFFTDALQQTENQLIAESQNNIVQALDKQIQRGLKKINK